MNTESTLTTPVASPLRCLRRAAPGVAPSAIPIWPRAWRSRLRERPLLLSDDHQEALARIVPLMVCGEQSAVAVFAKAATRPDDKHAARLRAAFNSIEQDEAGHEAAWQALFSALPAASDLVLLKRRAAVFFTRLGRAASVADHFAQVAQLDSAVCVMMRHLERSAVTDDPRIAELVLRIKRDEARHVSISRRYARALGVPRSRYEELGARIRHELVDMLEPIGGALEDIGVDADEMFRRVAARGANSIAWALA